MGIILDLDEDLVEDFMFKKDVNLEFFRLMLKSKDFNLDLI